jgi:outer membrane lipoprotein LolB
MALTIQSEPAQSMAAGFELRGNPSQGELQLFSPFGSTLAVLSWTPNQASLQQHGTQQQNSGSLDDLVAQATGAQIPVMALFDWLNDIPTAVKGWQADLSHLSEGRLQVQRLEPLPAVELRLKLDP